MYAQLPTVDHKRVRRLLHKMGIQAIYPKPKTRVSSAEHKIYPYLLWGLDITHINQVWSADITYLAMPRGWKVVFVSMPCTRTQQQLIKRLRPPMDTRRVATEGDIGGQFVQFPTDG